MCLFQPLFLHTKILADLFFGDFSDPPGNHIRAWFGFNHHMEQCYGYLTLGFKIVTGSQEVISWTSPSVYWLELLKTGIFILRGGQDLSIHTKIPT